MPGLKLAVGMINPAKVNAALLGSRTALKGEDITMYEYEVCSGVSLQPVGDEETLKGAITRAKGAYDAHLKQHHTPPDFALGLESGVAASIICHSDLESFSWIAVYDGKKLGRARTSSVVLPPPVTHLVLEEGMETTAAFDYFFNTMDFTTVEGFVGHLTGGSIKRAAYFEQAVVMSFVPFLWEELYDDMGGDAVVRLMDQREREKAKKGGSGSRSAGTAEAEKEREEEIERRRQEREDRGCLGNFLHMLFFAE
ncbi:DUF84 family protein [archaeon]|nr:MAG: DUF84 family protein [archaeon]